MSAKLACVRGLLLNKVMIPNIEHIVTVGKEMYDIFSFSVHTYSSRAKDRGYGQTFSKLIRYNLLVSIFAIPNFIPTQVLSAK